MKSLVKLFQPVRGKSIIKPKSDEVAIRLTEIRFEEVYVDKDSVNDYVTIESHKVVIPKEERFLIREPKYIEQARLIADISLETDVPANTLRNWCKSNKIKAYQDEQNRWWIVGIIEAKKLDNGRWWFEQRINQ
ncbi:MAG: hypothetical protein H6657_15290 [Ardenticatenaceae bacterium]|nr:hypothetical protein [Ardenticatenaceae bacterium]